MQIVNSAGRTARRHSVQLSEALEARQFLSASSLDTSFGGGTGRITPTYGTVATFNSVESLPDGKVLAAGTVLNGSHKHDFVVARFNSNGSVDTSFGGGTGRVFTDFSNHEDTASKLILLSGGKFLVVGRSTAASESTQAGIDGSDFAIVRYNASGSLDTSFNGSGKKTIDFVGLHDEARAAAVLSDGKLLIVGTANSGGFRGPDFAAVRLNTNGSIDTSFASSGKLRSHFGVPTEDSGGNHFIYGNQTATSVAVLPSGGFLIGGSIDDFFDSGVNLSDFAVAKYTASGNLDTSFGGGDGWAQIHFGSGNYGFSTSMAVLSSGKIIMAGGVTLDGIRSISDLGITRLNSNGSVDTSFGPSGSNGKVVTHLETGSQSTGEQINAFLVQPNGKILTTGSYVNNDDNTARMFLVRYNSTGTLDSSFSGDGKQIYTQLTGANGIGFAPGGKTLVAGFLGLKAGIVKFGSDYSSANASISGTFFNDLNGNGVRNTGEGVLAGWQAFVDSNNDGFYTPGEAVATSNSFGKYTITGLVPGTYRIREVRMANWNRTKPAGAYPLGYYDVIISSVGQVITGKDFGNKHV
jgi:uncharacterized delta-60 repeat protein